MLSCSRDLAVPAVLYWLVARRDTARTAPPAAPREDPQAAGLGG